MNPDALFVPPGYELYFKAITPLPDTLPETLREMASETRKGVTYFKVSKQTYVDRGPFASKFLFAGVLMERLILPTHLFSAGNERKHCAKTG